jgi:hypothetical protein
LAVAFLGRPTWEISSSAMSSGSNQRGRTQPSNFLRTTAMARRSDSPIRGALLNLIPSEEVTEGALDLITNTRVIEIKPAYRYARLYATCSGREKGSSITKGNTLTMHFKYAKSKKRRAEMARSPKVALPIRLDSLTLAERLEQAYRTEQKGRRCR